MRVVRALRVCGTRRPLWLGTCPCALVVAGGVPLWRASWPRVVRRASSGPVAVGAPVGFPDAVVPFRTPGAWAPGFTGRLRGARGGRPRGFFVCYGRNKGFNHDHRTCPIRKADTEAYKKVHGSKKRAPAGIRGTKVEVNKDELSKLMSVGTELAKEVQEIKRNWVPRSHDKNKENKENDKNKDKDKKGKKGGKKKGVNKGDAEESTPTTTSDAP